MVQIEAGTAETHGDIEQPHNRHLAESHLQLLHDQMLSPVIQRALCDPAATLARVGQAYLERVFQIDSTTQDLAADTLGLLLRLRSAVRSGALAVISSGTTNNVDQFALDSEQVTIIGRIDDMKHMRSHWSMLVLLPDALDVDFEPAVTIEARHTVALSRRFKLSSVDHELRIKHEYLGVQDMRFTDVELRAHEVPRRKPYITSMAVPTYDGSGPIPGEWNDHTARRYQEDAIRALAAKTRQLPPLSESDSLML